MNHKTINEGIIHYFHQLPGGAGLLLIDDNSLTKIHYKSSQISSFVTVV